MRVPKGRDDFLTRFNQIQADYRKRDQLVQLCREMYEIKKTQKSGYLGADATSWRNKVPAQYWESDNRPQNVIDVMTAVLAGNPPQWRATIPGDIGSSVPSRAEKFLAGVFRLNSRRQQIDLFSYLIFRTCLDGGVGIRIYWDTEAGGPTKVSPVEVPEEEGIKSPMATYTYKNFPIVIEVVDINKIYLGGRGRAGVPFDELYHVESRTPNEVLAEWDGVEGAQLSFVSDYNADKRDLDQFEYIEWWAEDKDGKVYYACMFDKQYVIKPKPIDYPSIPYVLTAFKVVDKDNPEFQRVPFLFPILWATQRKEYVKSRATRMVDLYGNIPPIYRGDQGVQLQGTWGDSLNLGPEDAIEFPRWPGNPPDLYRIIEDQERVQAEGTVSSAMFGEVSSRMSGYALSQLVGSDTLRTVTPKGNIELALSSVGDLIFGLMRKFAPDLYLSVNMRSEGQKLSAMLQGNETELLTVDCFIKPRHVADEIKLATLGAQLASLPKPPVSNAYILEHYFGMEQPEDEIRRRLSEDALNDPLVRLITMFEVLQESNSFAAPIVQSQIEALTKQQLGPSGPSGPPGVEPSQSPMPQIGGGLPQALGGNPPMLGPTGNVVEEVGPTPETMRQGGPVEY